ncbi:MAG: ABC transporter permease [Burkholderiaceae bacterium]|nr:ABC transporter permease [Burkholderiaceae bacterium]
MTETNALPAVVSATGRAAVSSTVGAADRALGRSGVSTSANPRRPSSAGRRSATRRVVGVVGVLALGELVTRFGITDPQYVPYVSTVLKRMFELCVDVRFLSQTADTIQAWLIGLGLSVVVGVALGFAIGSNRFLDKSFRALFDFIRPIPSVALIPLGLLVLGQGLQLKIALIVYAAAWPVLYNVVSAIRSIDRVQHDTARVFRIGRVARFVHVFLPSTLPNLATGIRVASPIALVLAISVEMLGGSRSGLGVWILDANTGAGRADLVFAGTAIAGLLGASSNWILATVERRLLPWHPSYRTEAAR